MAKAYRIRKRNAPKLGANRARVVCEQEHRRSGAAGLHPRKDHKVRDDRRGAIARSIKEG